MEAVRGGRGATHFDLLRAFRWDVLRLVHEILDVEGEDHPCAAHPDVARGWAVTRECIGREERGGGLKRGGGVTPPPTVYGRSNTTLP